MNNKKTVGMEDFSVLYEKYGPMVLRRCRYILKDEEKLMFLYYASCVGLKMGIQIIGIRNKKGIRANPFFMF